MVNDEISPHFNAIGLLSLVDVLAVRQKGKRRVVSACTRSPQLGLTCLQRRTTLSTKRPMAAAAKPPIGYLDPIKASDTILILGG